MRDSPKQQAARLNELILRTLGASEAREPLTPVLRDQLFRAWLFQRSVVVHLASCVLLWGLVILCAISWRGIVAIAPLPPLRAALHWLPNQRQAGLAWSVAWALAVVGLAIEFSSLSPTAIGGSSVSVHASVALYYVMRFGPFLHLGGATWDVKLAALPLTSPLLSGNLDLGLVALWALMHATTALLAHAVRRFDREEYDELRVAPPADGGAWAASPPRSPSHAGSSPAGAKPRLPRKRPPALVDVPERVPVAHGAWVNQVEPDYSRHWLGLWCADPALERHVRTDLFRRYFFWHEGLLMLLSICCATFLLSSPTMLGVTQPAILGCALFRMWLHELPDRRRAQRLAELGFLHFDACIIFLHGCYWSPLVRGDADVVAPLEPMPTLPWWMAALASLLLVLVVLLIFLLLPAWTIERVALLCGHGLLSIASPWPLPLTRLQNTLFFSLVLTLSVLGCHVIEAETRTFLITTLRMSREVDDLRRTNSLLQTRDKATEAERRVLFDALDPHSLPHALLAGRVDVEELEMGELLGRGSFGVCHAASWEGRAVATKTLYRNRITSEQLGAFRRAAGVELCLARHPNVVRLHGIAWSVQRAIVILVMERCRGGTLADALRGATAGWGAARKLRVAHGLAEGLAFLHAQAPPICHRDLKPDNVLFADEARTIAQIADFGCSRVSVSDADTGADATMTEGIGTPIFSAPELLAGKRYDHAIDTWALGCVYACLWRDCLLPYNDSDINNNRMGMIRQISVGELAPSLDELEAVPAAVAAVRDCCQLAPEARPTVVEVAARLDSAHKEVQPPILPDDLPLLSRHEPVQSQPTANINPFSSPSTQTHPP